MESPIEIKVAEKPQDPPQPRLGNPRRRSQYQDPETRRFATLYVLDRIYGEARGSILLKLGSKLSIEAQDLLADHLDRNILSLRPWNTQWTSLAGLLKLTHPFFEQPQPFFRRLHSHLRSRQGVYRAHSELSD